MNASEPHIILGQSPRSAEIINQQNIGSTSWWISAGIYPSTMIPRAMPEGYAYKSHNSILATNYSVSAGNTYHMHKHIDILSSIGSQLNASQVYLPIQVEGRIFPFRKNIKPYVSIGIGGMLSNSFILYASRGFGINAGLTKDIHLDIYYRQIKGDVFLFKAFNQERLQLSQHGIQASVFFSI
jgi:hypothetical protein